LTVSAEGNCKYCMLFI